MSRCSSRSPARSGCGATPWCAPCSTNRTTRRCASSHGLAQRLGPHITACARVRAVESRDWERVWLADWKSMRFGRRLWVCPTSAQPPAGSATPWWCASIRDSPSAPARHPTTALCLQLLDALPLVGPLRDRLRVRLRHLGHCRLEARRGARDRGRSGPSGAASPRAKMPFATACPRRLETQDVPAALRPASCVVANILARPLIELAPILTAACAARARSVLVGTAEDAGLCGKGRVHLGF